MRLSSFPIHAFKNIHTIHHYDVTTYAVDVVSRNEQIINESIRPSISHLLVDIKYMFTGIQPAAS
jgi:phage-related protein